MNSVTPIKNRNISFKKEDSAKELLVLIGCVLFSLFCVVSLFDRFPKDTKSVQNLQVGSGQHLVLKTFSGQFSKNNLLLNFPKENLHLTPFFFLPVAINYCEKPLLMSIKGIGPSLADRILETRNRVGVFSNAEDLLQVRGIGPIRLAKLKPYLSFITYHE